MAKGGVLLGPVSVTGAILFMTGWFAFVEFDRFSEPERKRIIGKIKSSPLYMMMIALMPIGVLLHIIGMFFVSLSLVVTGSTLIFVQGIIVSLLFWKRKRWKSILLLSAIVILGVFIYIPVFI